MFGPYDYNASTLTLVEYIRKGLTINYIIRANIDGQGKDTTEHVYSIDDKSFNEGSYITRTDIFVFVKVFQYILNQEFKRLEALKTYIKAIVKICCRLDIPVPWVLPSGAIVSQGYLASKTLKIQPFAFTSSRYNFKTILKDVFIYIVFKYTFVTRHRI